MVEEGEKSETTVLSSVTEVLKPLGNISPTRTYDEVCSIRFENVEEMHVKENNGLPYAFNLPYAL